MADLCCAREHSVQFFVQLFYTVKLHGYNGYRVFPQFRKRPGRDADPSPPSSAEV
jgi:hypothetical protein